MTQEQAIRILMESPIYFVLGLAERKQLIEEYRQHFINTKEPKKKQQKR
jgi:hypothetical protein